MMRRIFSALAAVFLLGCAGSAALTCFSVWIILSDGLLAPWMTVGTVMDTHLSWVGWSRDISEQIYSKPMVDWAYSLPAVAFFPLRMLFLLAVGVMLLRLAKRMDRPSMAT